MKGFEKHLPVMFLSSILLSICMFAGIHFRPLIPVAEIYVINITLNVLIFSIGIFMLMLAPYMVVRTLGTSVKKFIEPQDRMPEDPRDI